MATSSISVGLLSCTGAAVLDLSSTAEEKSIKLIIKAMPGLKAFMYEKLSPAKSRLNGDSKR